VSAREDAPAYLPEECLLNLATSAPISHPSRLLIGSGRNFSETGLTLPGFSVVSLLFVA